MSLEIQNLDVLSVLVHESVLISEHVVIGVILGRFAIWEVFESKETVVSVSEYRKLTGDYTGKEEGILERLQFLEALCRNIIKNELQN